MATKKNNAPAGKLKIQYYRSAIGFNEQQKLIVKGLGLRKLNAVREAEDTPAIRGMIAKVPHLVRILE
jgi:large subunit ribosomal protein L30